ncbi:MAG: excinuclease ABC subunit UvrC, partial [Deltaproteobacteria bacterium]|nr:excinuclease ABC subunit UvrC [Deltaproteobacteria bacterium]
GPGRRKALLTGFGSLEAVKAAGIEQISAIKGMTKEAAEAVFRYFQEQE